MFENVKSQWIIHKITYVFCKITQYNRSELTPVEDTVKVVNVKI